MQSADINDLVAQIRRHELTLAKMYAQFAKSYPNHRQLLSQLAREEVQHAEWMKSLAQHHAKGRLGLSDFKLNPQVLKTSISHLEKQIEESKQGRLSLRKAVSIALDVEKSMIENKFFKIFDLVDGKRDRIRAGLEKETSKHRQKLEKLLSEISRN